jgi:hypothetical protein
MKKRLRRFRLDSSVTDGIIFRYFRSLDSPRSLALWLLYKHGEHDQLSQLEINPLNYCSSQKFRDDYLATMFLSKSNFLKINVDRKKAAMDKFWQSESKCLETNLKWNSRREFSPSDWHAISCVANKIYSILGPSPNIESWLDKSSWGPGASLSVKKRDASSFKKFRDERGITADASVILPLMHLAYPLLEEKVYCVETGDRVVVVPKNAKIDRVILIQPGWNLWFQKGMGKLIRSKLRFSGLDLDIADKNNQLLSRVGSRDSSLATVDFSSASDQIAIEPLREILPPDWFRLLDLLRCKRSADGSTRWNKFSSMGNGFTFELETLIFFCLAKVACNLTKQDEGLVSVFGDDVIIPCKAVASFHYLSELFGFTFNQKKTYSSGLFRESCGAHWFNGVDCKPIFLKEKISVIHDLYKIHNAIRLVSHRSLLESCDSRFIPCCDFIIRNTPSKYRLRIPFGFGDVGFIGNFDEATPSRARDGFEGFKFTALISIPITFETEEPSLLLVRLTEHSDQPRRNLVEVKSRTRIRFARILANEWYNLGPWI